MKKVICFGSFDLLHLGHLNYFKQAKNQGDHLTVVIARDKTKKDQKKEMIFSEDERLELIKNLKVVDLAILGNLENHLAVIEEVKPDILCLGYDQKVDEVELKEKLAKLNLYPVIKRLSSRQPDRYKSSLLREKVFRIN